MRTACILALLLAGCYRAHPAAGETAVDAGPGDAGPVDARVEPPRDGGIDAGTDAGIDAGVDGGVDGGVCAGAFEEPLVQLCSFAALGGLPAGMPSGLTLFYRACLCDARTCDVRVDGDVLELDTLTCPETVECDDCAYELACPTPPLARGDYQVRVDGRFVGTVTAGDATPIARPTCWAAQEPTDLVCGWPGTTTHAQQLCHRPLEDVGTQVEIDLLWNAGPCELPGECRARLDGRTIHLAWTRLACTGSEGCVAGPGTIVRCLTPPLRDGDYDVVVEDGSGLRSTLRIRDITTRGDVMCVGSDATIPP